MGKPSSFPASGPPNVIAAGKNGPPKKSTVSPSTAVKPVRYSSGSQSPGSKKVTPQRG